MWCKLHQFLIDEIVKKSFRGPITWLSLVYVGMTAICHHLGISPAAAGLLSSY
jgi:hypothetical protein